MVERLTPETYQLHLDGPMSLFTATQKYGLQLAFFLPALLHCHDFELKADLRWGAQRKPKRCCLKISVDGIDLARMPPSSEHFTPSSSVGLSNTRGELEPSCRTCFSATGCKHPQAIDSGQPLSGRGCDRCRHGAAGDRTP